MILINLIYQIYFWNWCNNIETWPTVNFNFFFTFLSNFLFYTLFIFTYLSKLQTYVVFFCCYFNISNIYCQTFEDFTLYYCKLSYYHIAIMSASKQQSKDSIFLSKRGKPPFSIISLCTLCTLLLRPANAGNSCHKYISLPPTQYVFRPTAQNICI